MTFAQTAQDLCLLIAAFGSAYAVVTVIAAAIFRRRMARVRHAAQLPPVTILKPLFGVDKHLLDNLRAACSLDYPDYQVVLSVQRLDDPAIPVMRQIEREFGTDRVTLVVANSEGRANGKMQNLENAWARARHDVVVISDSDIRLDPDYLKVIVAPLADSGVGCVCTPYRAIHARTWFEKLELLSMNADFVPSLVFAWVAGLLTFGLGASMCMRRADLEAIGGFGAFGEHLAEDYIMAAKISALGRRVVLVPYFVDMEVDLASPAQWWEHQLYWDQNTRAMRPVEFFATVFVRSVPFALLYALLTGFDATGLAVLATVLGVRLSTAAFTLARMSRDREGLAALWLLPVRDILGLVVWLVVVLRRQFVRRGQRFVLTAGGRIVPRAAR